MQAGVAVIDITPDANVEMSGYLARVQPSTGILTRLYAKALYLNDGQTELMWIHADLIGFESDFVRQVKKTIHAQAGIPSENIIISATHTHSGPATIHLTCCGQYDQNYVKTLGQKICEVANAARASTRPVDVYTSEALCDVAVDRRNKPSSHVDHRLKVISLICPDGKYAAVLTNYSMHNVGFSHNNRLISADIAGYASESIKSALPGNPEVFALNGACGNIDPPCLTTDQQVVKSFADRLAKAAFEAISRQQKSPSKLKISNTSFEVKLDLFDIPKAAVMADKAIKNLTGFAGTEQEKAYVTQRYKTAVDCWLDFVNRFYQAGTVRDKFILDISVVQIGKTLAVCIPAEVFSNLAQDLREKTGTDSFIAGYANGDMGYIPTSAAYDENGYEVDSAFMIYNSFRPLKGTFEKLESHLVDFIKNSFKVI